MKKEIIITIAGSTGSGKSRIAYIIKEMLRIHGLKVEFDIDTDFVDEQSFNKVMRTDFEECMESISKNTVVTVKQVQVCKNPIESKKIDLKNKLEKLLLAKFGFNGDAINATNQVKIFEILKELWD